MCEGTDTTGTAWVRIDTSIHREIKRLAEERGTSVGVTVALAIRRLRQEGIGRDLTQPLRENETAWLNAELG